MSQARFIPQLSRLISEYGMFFVLLLLCIYYSIVTLERHHPTGATAGDEVADAILATDPRPDNVLILGKDLDEVKEFASTVASKLRDAGITKIERVLGGPDRAREILDKKNEAGSKVGTIAASSSTKDWLFLDNVTKAYPGLGKPNLVRPESYLWPTFLKGDNLVNIASSIAIIAIMAIGMTMVIITAGIDLSVGSLLALSSVASAWLVREMGGKDATTFQLLLACLAGLLVCGLCGLFNGILITLCELPPFLVTLGMMLIASGCAWILASGSSINDFPTMLRVLDHGSTWTVPNTIILMLVLYAIAHVVMSHTIVGRYIYAVGGNPEAARLSGVPVKRVLILVYVVTGLLAGLAGLIMASRFLTGDPKYGAMYELTVIAAVVVGGTSLSGGEGKILGTLIGAFLIAVTQSGMNHTRVQEYTQKVVLGCIILAAVLLDRLNKRPWSFPRWWGRDNPEPPTEQ